MVPISTVSKWWTGESKNSDDAFSPPRPLTHWQQEIPATARHVVGFEPGTLPEDVVEVIRCLGLQVVVDSPGLWAGPSALIGVLVLLVVCFGSGLFLAFRFYHEQKSQWMKGSGFETTSAAEALVQQVNGSKNKDVRLAAVASLGTLGDAETLPLLVKLIGDSDVAVRDAA